MMKLQISKMGDKLVLFLPDELVERQGWAHGDELAVGMGEHAVRLTLHKSLHDRGLEIADELMEEYKETLAALARS